MPHRTLLVVEDDETIRGLLVEYFREHCGVDVDVARDGAEALHRLAEADYSVVILDLMMPHMSGIDFLDSLEALSSDPSLKALDEPPAVIVITSMPDETIAACDIENRFPSIVRGVLRKPLDVAALAQSVGALLQRAEAR
ncbi:MAG TPA: response regulator [Thermoanaerobaculia bacterium]|nr:response regulator [Thermoanaerobaculia bacterium]